MWVEPDCLCYPITGRKGVCNVGGAGLPLLPYITGKRACNVGGAGQIRDMTAHQYNYASVVHELCIALQLSCKWVCMWVELVLE